MSEIDVRDLQCENCRKFSHCNNNELVCISKFQQLKAENEELKNTIKEMEDDLDDWISDVSILYTYDDREPNNLDELQCCMEHAHEEWSKYKHCLREIEEIVKNSLDACHACNSSYSCMNCDKGEILQKIKEVKE